MSGTPSEKIVVESASIGGDFGGKGLTIDEFPCYFLAKATGRPVRYVSSYADELQNGTARHPAHITLRDGGRRDGTFLAHRSHVIFDGGAYAGGKPRQSATPGSSATRRSATTFPTCGSTSTSSTPTRCRRRTCARPRDVQIFFAGSSTST